MNTQHTQIIECSRRNAVGANTYGDYTTRDNAVWENRVDLDIPVGAMVNLEYAIINAKGSDADQTIEITGIEDKFSGITDNQILMEFAPYICDNGYNSVKLPFVMGMSFDTGGRKIVSDTTQNISSNFQYLSTAGIHEFIGSETNANVSSPHSQLGFTMFDDNDFQFSFNNSISQYSGYSPNTLMTCSNVAPTNEKYIKIHKDYQGWSKTGFANSAADEFYYSKYQDFKPEIVEVPIQINAPTYESPSTIANKINTILHTTYPQDDHTFGETPTNLLDGRIIPTANGLMINSYFANGYNTEGGSSGVRKRLWGQFAVEDYDRWAAIHTIMRCVLVDSQKVYVERTDAASGDRSTEFVYFNRPVIVIPKTTMKSSGNLPHYDSNLIEGDWSFFPKISKQFRFTNNENRTIDKTTYYTCLPKKFMFATNIAYTDDNVGRLRTLFQDCEEYIGDSSDPNNDDIENWMTRCDFGVSRNGSNGTNTRQNTGSGRPPIPVGGLPPLDIANQYNRPTWCNASLGVGFYNVSTPNAGNPNLIANDRSEYAFSVPITQLGISFTFADAMNSVDVNQHEQYTHFNFAPSTKRSDIPEVNYRGWYFDNFGDVGDNWNTNTITTINTDVPHRFKDNFTKDASVCCYARYDKDWKTNSRTNNFKTEDGNGDYTKSGYGTYRNHSMFFTNEDGSTLDDSISQKYNIGVYPVRIEYQNTFEDFYYNMNNRAYNGLQSNGGTTYYQNMILWTNDGNRNFVKWWKESPDTDFTPISDFYVYDCLNETIGSNYPTLAGNTYTDNGVLKNVPVEGAIPLGTFIFDRGATKRWIGIMDTTTFDIDIFPFTNNNVWNTADAKPFGSLAVAGADINKLVFINTGADGGRNGIEPALSVKSAGKYPDNEVADPTLEPNGEYEIVCGFRLFRDSATIDANGDFQPTTDFALPQLYNGQYCPISTSFLDNPAVWLINNERVDSNSDVPDAYNQMVNYVNLGANDPTCEFDSAQSRTLFRSLHTARQLGINEMPTDGNGDFVTTTLGQLVVKFNDTKQPYANLINLDDTQPKRAYSSKIKGTGLQDATTGQFIYKIYGQRLGDLITSGEDANAVEIKDEQTFFNSLLYKLGFKYEDLFPNSGTQVARHNEAYENNFSKVNRYKSVKPLTTNADFSISAQPDLATQDHTEINNAGAGKGTFKLGYNGTNEFSLQQEQSTEIIASGLPTKLDTSFYQVYTNLVPADYQQSQEKLNCIGIVPRNYTSGDFVYSYASSYQIPVAFPTKIHSIKTEIRLPTGELAPINEKSSIIYKITTPMLIPDPVELATEIVKQEQKIQEHQQHSHEKEKTK
tara:strand:- start:730 stop:4698 length:3969 start_codon:yes stop_codon:yes gene_type:complete